MITSSLCFSQSVHKTCQRQVTALKFCRLIVYLKFHKICKFENHVTRNDVIMMSLPKTMENNGNMRTSVEPNKMYIVLKVLMRAIQNVAFSEFEPLCQKLWAFMSSFNHNHSLNMVMSSDPGCKFRCFFCLILY